MRQTMKMRRLRTNKSVIRQLTDEEYDKLAAYIEDALMNKKVNRAARRRLSQIWARCKRRNVQEEA